MARIVPALFGASREKKLLDKMRDEWAVCEREVSDEPVECPCGKKNIRELCWIRNRITGHRMFVGNCCIKFLADKGYCAECGIYEVVSHTAHYCEYCGRNRNDKPSGVVEKGTALYGPQVIGLPYREAYYRNPSLAKWLVATPAKWKYYDRHWIAFLQKLFRDNTPLPSGSPKRMEKSVGERQVADSNGDNNNADDDDNRPPVSLH